MAEYTKADFTIGLDFGAGIKGKVLESMEHCTISLEMKLVWEYPVMH